MSCRACDDTPFGICPAHEEVAEARAEAAADRRAERMYGDTAERRFEDFAYGERR